MSHDDEAITNESRNPHINDLIQQRLQDSKRRSLFKSGLGLAALSFIGSSPRRSIAAALRPSHWQQGNHARSELRFAPHLIARE